MNTVAEHPKMNIPERLLALGAVGAAIGVLVVPNVARIWRSGEVPPPSHGNTPTFAGANTDKLITESYTVGVEPADQMVSAISADLHAIAPNQDQTEENSIVRTYLPKADQEDYRVRAGEEFNFIIDKSTGRILPNPNADSSATGH